MNLLNLFLLFVDTTSFGTDINVPVESFLPVNPPLFIIIGIGLIIATIIIIFFLKKMIINSILGGVIWFIVVIIFKVNLPLVPSLIISLIIGPAGLGTMLLLNAFGLLVI